MYRISDAQIDFILEDIKRRGIEMEDLQNNLLDHICCVIENEMTEKDDFETFYNKTIKKFFRHELWEIEEETIQVLTFKHFYAMKKTMIISGFISSLLIIAGSIFKFFRLPGTAPMFVLGIAIFVFLFLPLMFVLKIREKQQTREKVVLTVGLLVAILGVISTVFKVMHWPMAEIFKITSILTLLALFVPVYFFTGIRNPDNKLNTIVTSVLLIAGGGMLWFLTSMRPSIVLENTAFSSDISLNYTVQNLYQVNDKTVKELLSDSSYRLRNELKEFHPLCTATYAEIDSVKNFLSRNCDSELKYSYSHEGKIWVDYASSSDWERPTNLLFGNQQANLSSVNLAKRLEEMEKHERSQNDYYVFWDKTLSAPKLSQIVKQIETLNKKARHDFYSITPFFGPVSQISRTIPDSTGEGFAGNGDWIMSNFYHVSQSVVMRTLTQLQLNVCLIESAALMRR